MPPGAPNHSYIDPYRIRVDDFTNIEQHPAVYYLLSHTHADHTTGLQSDTFGGEIICSREAKHMLLNYETWADKAMKEENEYRKLTYQHLKNGRRDLLVSLALDSCTILTLDLESART